MSSFINLFLHQIIDGYTDASKQLPIQEDEEEPTAPAATNNRQGAKLAMNN
jgi:hypothetical protein